MTNQESKQIAFRAISGTTLDYNSDFMSAAAAEGIPISNYNSMLMLWLQARLSSTNTNINGLKQEMATSLGVANWDAITSFSSLPSAISGLAVWYDFSSVVGGVPTAAAYLTLSGTAITQALDRSTSANDTAVQGTATARPTFATSQLNGKSLATFDGGDTLLAPAALYTLPTGNWTFIAVAKRDTEAGTSQAILSFADVGISVRSHISFSATAGSVSFRHNASTLSTVTDGRNTTYQILTAFRSGTTQSLAVAGGTPVSPTTATDPGAITRLSIGTIDGSVNPLTGGVAEIIMYNRALTGAEILSVELYVAEKYGLYHPSATWINAYTSSQQSIIHALKSNKDNAFQATTGNLLTGWFDASNASSITSSSNLVSQWNDLSGRGFNVTATTTARPTIGTTTQSGRNTLTFDGTANTMTMPTALLDAFLNTGNTIFAVTRNTATDAVIRRVFAMDSGANARISMFANTSATGTMGYQSRNLSGGSTGQAGYTLANFNLFTSYRSGTTQSISVNSAAETTNLSGADTTPIDNGRIGSSGNGATLFWQGEIAEFIVFNSVLTATQITAMNNYLKAKWGTV